MSLDALRLNNGVSAYRNAADSYLRMSEEAKKARSAGLREEETVKGNEKSDGEKGGLNRESRYNPDGTLKEEFLKEGELFKSSKTDKTDKTDKAEKTDKKEKLDPEEEDKNAQVSDKDDKKATDKKEKDGFLKDPPDCECETCRKRRYQDASDDSHVSFQNPTKMPPLTVKSRVRSHELEHVRRESAKAKQEGKRVVSQTVQIKTATCGECGRIYVAGGLTRTVTRPDMRDFHNMFMLGFDEEDVVDKDIV